MADTGRISKTFDMYIDEEEAAAAITKGQLVSFTVGAATVAKTVGSADDLPPYGVALEAMAAAAATGLVAWRGICYVNHDITADDAITKGELLKPGSVAGTVVGGITTEHADLNPCIVVGHALESVTSIDAEVLIMLKGW